MEVLEINDKRLEVPEGWGDITLGHYEEISKLKPETARDLADFAARVCKTDTLNYLPVEVFNRIADKISFLFSDDPFTPSSFVQIGGVKYFVNTEETLTLGEWVDADEVQKRGENVLAGVLAIVCRPAGEKYDCGNNEEREKLFSSAPVSAVSGALAFFFGVQGRIRETYGSIFTPLATGRPVAPEYKKFAGAWGWYKIIAELAENKISDFDKITSLAVTEVFTFLQYRRDREYAEEAQRKLDRLTTKTRKQYD